MFITKAYAQDASGLSGGASFITFVPFILIFAIMYLFIIRPQRVQMKQRQEMLSAVRRGDTIVTGGGIVGKVTKVHDESGELEIEVGDGVRVRVVRSTLADVRVKGKPLIEEQPRHDTKEKGQKKPKSKATVKKNSVPNKEKKASPKENTPKA